jgi:hypothetical protein
MKKPIHAKFSEGRFFCAFYFLGLGQESSKEAKQKNDFYRRNAIVLARLDGAFRPWNVLFLCSFLHEICIMPITDKDIEFLFQEEVLDQHGEYLLDLFVESIEQKNIKVSEDLLESLNYKVTRTGNDRVLNVSFLTYGRFIEIRRHKMNKSRSKDVNTNSLIWGHKQNSLNKKAKDVDWYSKNSFGSLNRLISILMYELGDEERARLIGILRNRENNEV